MLRDPFSALREALESGGAPLSSSLVTPDFERDLRTGVPEVVLCAGKDRATVMELARLFLERRGRAILSRVRPGLLRSLRDEFGADTVESYYRASMAIIRRDGARSSPTGGKVAIVTAGTSDVGWAEQAQVIAEEMGCTTLMAGDVGVAGLHRLVGPLRHMIEWGADVVVVVAGMDGALPSVVAGLVDVPVIGLPTSRGYGLGGRGRAALLSMLQSCVPGLLVVNVDNGIGAGASAARIANRVAAGRIGQRLSAQGAR